MITLGSDRRPLAIAFNNPENENIIEQHFHSSLMDSFIQFQGIWRDEIIVCTLDVVLSKRERKDDQQKLCCNSHFTVIDMLSLNIPSFLCERQKKKGKKNNTFRVEGKATQ